MQCETKNPAAVKKRNQAVEVSPKYGNSLDAVPRDSDEFIAADPNFTDRRREVT